MPAKSLQIHPDTSVGQTAADSAIDAEMDAHENAPAKPRAKRGKAKTADDLGSDNVNVGGVAADRLRSLIERIERLEEERKALASDIKDVFAESASAGFDNVILKQILRLRKQEPAEIEEQESLLDVYKRALGM